MYRFFLILALSLPAYGGGEVSDIVKKNSNFINEFAADSIYNFFSGPGYTEVEMRGIENKKPEFSILLVRPIKLTETKALFSQLSLNHYYVRIFVVFIFVYSPNDRHGSYFFHNIK